MWIRRFSNNKACKVYSIQKVQLNVFDNYMFFLRNVRYVPKLKQTNLFISMFDDLDNCTKI